MEYFSATSIQQQKINKKGFQNLIPLIGDEVILYCDEGHWKMRSIEQLSNKVIITWMRQPVFPLVGIPPQIWDFSTLFLALGDFHFKMGIFGNSKLSNDCLILSPKNL